MLNLDASPTSPTPGREEGITTWYGMAQEGALAMPPA
jgi:hypothetical protein